MFFFFKNEEPKSCNTDWQPTQYKFPHLKDYWFDICGFRNPIYFYDIEDEQRLLYSEFAKHFYQSLDHIIDKLEYACEKEFHCNSKYLDCNWIYYTLEQKEDYIIENIVHKIVEDICENMERILNFPHDFYEKIEYNIKEQLYKIGLEYFKVQFENQSMLNHLCGDDIRYKKAKKSKETQEKLKNNSLIFWY